MMHARPACRVFDQANITRRLNPSSLSTVVVVVSLGTSSGYRDGCPRLPDTAFGFLFGLSLIPCPPVTTT